MGKAFLRLVWHFLERVFHVIMHNLLDSLLLKPLKAWACDHASLLIGLLLLGGAIWGIFEQNRPENPPKR